MSQNNTERIVLYVDSEHKDSGTNENFSVILANNITKIIEVEVIGAEIPYTFYALNSSNNTIRWTDSSSIAYSASIPVGNYGITAYVTNLKNAMNLVMPGFTITYIKERYQLSFANTAAFRLDFTGSTIASQIGLTSVTPASGFATTVNPPGVINIGGPRYLLIKSTRLTRPKITRPYLNDIQDDVLYKLQISGAPGDILIEKNSYSNLLKYGVRQTIKTIDFQLTDDKNNLIDLNGQSWSLTINLVTG